MTLTSVIIFQCREYKVSVCRHLYDIRWSSISLWPPAVWHSQNNTPIQKCTAQHNEKKKKENPQNNKTLLRRIQLISNRNRKIDANLDKIQLSKWTFARELYAPELFFSHCGSLYLGKFVCRIAMRGRHNWIESALPLIRSSTCLTRNLQMSCMLSL